MPSINLTFHVSGTVGNEKSKVLYREMPGKALDANVTKIENHSKQGWLCYAQAEPVGNAIKLTAGLCGYVGKSCNSTVNVSGYYSYDQLSSPDDRQPQAVSMNMGLDIPVETQTLRIPVCNKTTGTITQVLNGYSGPVVDAYIAGYENLTSAQFHVQRDANDQLILSGSFVHKNEPLQEEQGFVQVAIVTRRPPEQEGADHGHR